MWLPTHVESTASGLSAISSSNNNMGSDRFKKQCQLILRCRPVGMRLRGGLTVLPAAKCHGIPSPCCEVESGVLAQVLAGGWPQDVTHRAPSSYGPKSARLKQVEETHTLAEVLRQSDYVVPGIPVFFLLAAGTPFLQRFLEDD